MTNEVLQTLEKKKGLNLNVEGAITAAEKVESKKVLPPGKRVYLPVTMRRGVWAKAQGRCEFQHKGRRCTSRYRLEIDLGQPIGVHAGESEDQGGFAVVHVPRGGHHRKGGPGVGCGFGTRAHGAFVQPCWRV